MKRWKAFAEENYPLLEQTLWELARIPAPSCREEKRRAYCEQWLDRFKIPHRSDPNGNLLIPYRIREGRRNRMAVAHMDVVFDESVPLHPVRDGSVWRCPGIGDNTANVVLLLLCAKYLYEEQPETKAGLWLAADTCEEGLGNLDGCRKLMEELGDRLEAVLAFDLYRDRIYIGCIGSVRYRITAKTPGGHSFADFGAPNAIRVLSGLVNRLYEYRTKGCTTYNVGVISGGTSVNTIAQEASMLFEYRSDSAQELRRCREYLAACLEEAGRREGPAVTICCELVGERPCAEGIDQSGIDRIAEICRERIRESTGILPEKAKASTDCNIPLSMGIPAVCAGFYRGGGAHTREEWIDMSTVKAALEAAAACVECFAGETAEEASPVSFVPRERITDSREQAQVYEILEECDQDFCPPLSFRSSTSQKELCGAKQGNGGVALYYQEILQQPAMLVKRGERVIGFLSYRIGYTCKALEEYGEVCYLTTLCLRHEERGKGLSPRIYEAAEAHIRERYPRLPITLRTWSTNQAQLHLMKKLGYRLTATLKNDRGEQIDTVYYVKDDAAAQIK